MLSAAALLFLPAPPAAATTTFTFSNLHSGKCLEILNYSTADFGEAVQYNCYEGANQVWASPQWWWPT
ncbi:RICIN domain-containing protein [Nonomuraea dietziae]|uniref:RICIN domain-containing protein n=1 Tax=Nonomuraea dietziae TaxID=65515 RepID=UPI00340E50DC